MSGAYHELNSLPVSLAAATPAGPKGTVIRPPSEAGFAVLGGVKILTPFTAKGDSVTLQGTYQSGAMDYVNPINYQPVGFSNVYDNNTSITVPVNDAFVSPLGRIVKSEAYGGYGAARHYWIPSVYSSLFGDFLRIRNPSSAQLLGAGADNARIYQVGFNTVWLPVKDFQIGAEVLYSNLLLTGRTILLDNPASGVTPRNPDDYRARLSLRRAF